jgi:hypothetical protein
MKQKTPLYIKYKGVFKISEKKNYSPITSNSSSTIFSLPKSI